MRIVRLVVFATLAWLLAVQLTALADETAAPEAAAPIVLKQRVARKPAVKPVVRATPKRATLVRHYESYTLPARYRVGKALDVSIANQRLTVWQDGKLVRRLVISTGKPGYETPLGDWHIIYKAVNGWSRKYQVVMPWMMQFHNGYTIHQLAHERGSTYLFGRGELGTPASHGCVRVRDGDAEWLWHWTPAGTPLWIH